MTEEIIIVEGEEKFGYAHRSRCQPRVLYNIDAEMELVSCDDMGYIVQRPGCFAVAFLEDAHQSACIHKTPCKIKKILVKILLEK